MALERAGIPFTVHEYPHDPRHESYGREASEALGVSSDRVFKTLIAEVDGSLVTGVVPVEGQLDLKALAVLARVVGEAGDLDRAEALAQEIPDSDRRARALADLVKAAGATVADISR